MALLCSAAGGKPNAGKPQNNTQTLMQYLNPDMAFSVGPTWGSG
jgi:hypothetical protein